MNREMASIDSLESELTQVLLIENATTLESELKQLIQSNMNSDGSIMKYILDKLVKDTRKLFLINIFIQSFPIEYPPLEYITHILSVLQLNITQHTLSDIINLFSELTQRTVFHTNESNANEDADADAEADVTPINISHIQMLIAFCFTNMKETETIKQRTGSLCLGQLILLTPISPSMTKSLWKSIIEFIDSKAFIAKNELLTVLDVLIERVKEGFSSYATVTLYKALDFLTESDWVRRKLTLKVIYDLVCYCSEDIAQLKQQIIEFLDVVRNDKVEEVALMCESILDIISKPKTKTKTKCNLKGKGNKGNSEGLEVLGKKSVLLNEILISEEESHLRRSGNDNNEVDNSDFGVNKVVMTSPLKISDLKEGGDIEGNENRPLQIENQSKQMDKDKDYKVIIQGESKPQTKSIHNNNRNNNHNDTNKHQLDKQNTNANENHNDNYDNLINDNTNRNSEYKITDLIKQMKEMSDKQVYLLDVLSSLQKSSQEQIATLNTRIMCLESSISDYTNPNYKSSNSMKNIPFRVLYNINDILPNMISSSSDKDLITYISSLSPDDLEQIKLSLIEDIVMRYTLILSKGFYMKEIITFLKSILLKKKNKFRKITYKNLNDMLLYVSKNKGIVKSESDLVEISLINSLLCKRFLI